MMTLPTITVRVATVSITPFGTVQVTLLSPSLADVRQASSEELPVQVLETTTAQTLILSAPAQAAQPTQL